MKKFHEMQFPYDQRGLHADRGYNIGVRLIDEFLAKSRTAACSNFRDSAEKVAKVIAKS